MTNIDWAAIRSDHEQGVSSRTLALKYGIPRSTIRSRLAAAAVKVGEVGEVGERQSRQERQAHTIPDARPSPTLSLGEPIASPAQQSTSLNAAIAQNLIRMIAKHITGQWKRDDVRLEPHTMKLLADTLSQCNKILVGEEAGENAGTPERIDWSLFTFEELTIIQPLFERALARQQPENVTAFRRQA